MSAPLHLLPTTVIGSYPQPDWLIDRDRLRDTLPPRVRARELWRVAEPYLAEAQDDATALAIADQERAGVDIVTDGEIRRESYSNRFATALDGLDLDDPATVSGRAGGTTLVPRVVGPVRRTRPVEVDDLRFLRARSDRTIKITLPGPFTMSQQAVQRALRDRGRAGHGPRRWRSTRRCATRRPGSRSSPGRSSSRAIPSLPSTRS